MTNQIAGSIVDGIAWTQQAMLQLVQDMSDEMLAKQPGETAPPMGWHIFHIARWADRFASQFYPTGCRPTATRQNCLTKSGWLKT